MNYQLTVDELVPSLRQEGYLDLNELFNGNSVDVLYLAFGDVCGMIFVVSWIEIEIDVIGYN